MAEYYPRPDFQRTSLNWVTLNGKWGFEFDDKDVGLSQRWYESYSGKRTINVPFVFQTPASGINDQSAHEVIWYDRKITDPRTAEELGKGNHALMRFGAVDYEATVWVNGLYVGSHRGGHVPFDVDITPALPLKGGEEPHRVVIRVKDSPYDLTQPRGKQYWKPEPDNIWYTPSSGIWQNVWLESVPAVRIANSSEGTVLRADDIESGDLHATIGVVGKLALQPYAIQIEASYQGAVIRTSETVQLPRDRDVVNCTLNLRLNSGQLEEISQGFPRTELPNNPKYLHNDIPVWSPEHPFLYDITIRLYDSSNAVIDQVETHTGMRSIEWTRGDETFRLNGEPYFQALVLDQGYWPATGMTPPVHSSLREDVQLSKDMGFNGCRKHQKVEDPLFLYWADKLGYLVWGEIANAYEFDEKYVERFDQEWIECVKRDINHPCVVAWTPVNESWGYTDLPNNVEQRNHIRALYYMTKTLDPTRPINDNCGWEHVLTDLTTYHDYDDAAELAVRSASVENIITQKKPCFLDPIVNQSGGDKGSKHEDGAPVICSEFGGVNIQPAEGVPGATAKDWGYTTASDPQDLLKRVRNLVMAVVEPGVCCGLVYTQLTDIEQEVNGVYSFDRRAKLDPAAVKDIMDHAMTAYHKLRKIRSRA
ncbi:family 2 glycoside hydrolase [Eremomyces bilateralis CBS 781.70]|uniref:Family 2 glycoside hydrolase n=1 Tax=Eremomyces bilateralis CBS 781.70 TaxID=1392243 RepID=A0A6G1G8A3_9PEZI|nr:family 2 glycoside hydrolase [Eremomyces bilateralis CBS 781.70]KAF1814264.1 family 2 glycoside hydrolase [Eremomyces bilateralis CBS 781.70]